MSRFTVAARWRPDVDLPGYLGNYEFSSVSRSIFTEKGDLIRSKDKSKITSEMLECLPIENIAEESADSGYKVIVFDGMAVVNEIDIKKMKLKSCSKFASAFAQKLEKEAQGFDQVRVIFDQYTEESFKSGARTGRNGGEIVRYKISDDTVI